MRYVFVVLFLISFSTLFPQSKGSGKGSIVGLVSEKISGRETEPVLQATIRVLSVKDSSLVTGAVSDMDGKFEVKNLDWGSYLILISYIGYDPYYTEVTLSAREPVKTIDNVVLSSTSINLSEVVVAAKATEVVVKPDTVEFNPNAYTSKENDVIEDLLKKLPGVEVADDGTITYGGKTIEKILIDGKEFFSDDPLVASKNLPVDIIERLQVVDDRSDASKRTGVDDGERTKVINISVKKEKKKGWFGDAGVGYGTEDRYGAKAMVNRFTGDDKYTVILNSNNTNNMGFGDRSGQMRGGGSYGGGIITSHSLGTNLIKEFGKTVKTAGNINLNASSSEAERKSSRENIIGDSSYYSNSANKRNAESQGINFSYRIEYNPDTSNFFIFRPSFNYNHSEVTTLDSTETLDGNRIRINDGVAAYTMNNDNVSGGLSVEYIHRFKKAGRSIGFNAEGNISSSSGDGFNVSTNNFYKPIDSLSLLDQKINTSGQSKSIRGSVYYTEPLFHPRNYLQLRYSVRSNRNVSEKDTYRRDPLSDEYSVLDSLYSRGNTNDLLSQTISVSYRVVRDKYRFSLGARAEPTSTKNKSYLGDSTLSDLPRRNVFNIAPNAYYRYRFSSNSEFRADYRGSMSQPSSAQLLPVADMSNPLNIVTGNPDLIPSFTHTANVEYNNSKPERQTTMSTELGWAMTSNSINSISVLDKNTGIKRTSYVNVNGIWNAYWRFMLSLPFKNKRFQFNTFTFARYANNIGFVNGVENTAKTSSIMESLTLRYRIDKVMETGVRGNARYSGTVNSLQKSSDRQTIDYSGSYFITAFLPFDITVSSDVRYNSNWGYSAGFQKNEWIWNMEIMKSFLKKKNAILTFKAYDILGQMKNISRSVTGSYIEDAQFKALTSYALLTFTYKFNTFGGKMQGDPSHGRRGGRRTH